MSGKRSFTIIDVATTGKGIRNNRIIEIGIVRIEDGQIAARYDSLVDPEQQIPNYITARTSIDNAMVADAPTFADIAEKVDNLTKDAIFVAHGVSFHYHVVRSEFRYLGYNFSREKLCSMRLSKKLIPNLFSYELENLCSSLGIPHFDQHRAVGEVEAAVILFQRLLSLDEDFKVIGTLLKPKSSIATLPRNISEEQFAKLPSKPGIYKFQDKDGTIIYVGKAKNIKKRVLSHFQSNLQKEVDLCANTFAFDFETTGSELLALLAEADLIQKQMPKYNTVQKKSRTAFHIKSYHNKAGILQLAVEECPSVYEPTELFYTKGAAKKKLEQLCETYNLCPKFAGLQRKKGRCAHKKFPFCAGVCYGEEEIHIYNKRANAALTSLKADTESYVITENGRNSGEKGFVLVLDNVYQGYGFIDNSQQVSSVDDMLDVIKPRKHTYHTSQILKAYKRKYPYRVRSMATSSV